MLWKNKCIRALTSWCLDCYFLQVCICPFFCKLLLLFEILLPTKTEMMSLLCWPQCLCTYLTFKTFSSHLYLWGPLTLNCWLFRLNNELKQNKGVCSWVHFVRAAVKRTGCRRPSLSYRSISLKVNETSKQHSSFIYYEGCSRLRFYVLIII